VGESWEVADTDEVATRVAEGPLAGRTLREVLGAPFPLLVKVIDAREDLSVQVHPDGRDGPAAKEEAWVALADGGTVAVGLGPRADTGAPWLERLERRALTGAGAGARPPTLVHVPAGTVHAILAGSLVWEVQTPVDVTWRLDDYGRAGLDGRPRALHAREAAPVLARGPEPGGRVDPAGRALVGTRFRVDLHPPGTTSRGTACVAFLPAGGTVAGDAAADEVAVPAGRSVVLTERARALRSRGWVFTAAARGVPVQ
jgi:mannose-6-phosphate isomerase